MHEPQIYASLSPTSGVNGVFTIGFLGCSCGWNNDGKQLQKYSEHLDSVSWLIERRGLCLGFWGCKFAWVTFTNENALRFSRMIDAKNFKEAAMADPYFSSRKLHNSVITEHQWGRA